MLRSGGRLTNHLYGLRSTVPVHNMQIETQEKTKRIIIIFASLYFATKNCWIEEFPVYVQGVPKKTLFYVFANISAYTYSRETSRISTELAWQEASNDMRLDFLSYLVNEKINILCEILTLF